MSSRIDGPATRSTPRDAPDGRTYEVQRAVNRWAGRCLVAEDGRGGPDLSRALREFQRARGLPVTGCADEATVRALVAERGRGAGSRPATPGDGVERRRPPAPFLRGRSDDPGIRRPGADPRPPAGPCQDATARCALEREVDRARREAATEWGYRTGEGGRVRGGPSVSPDDRAFYTRVTNAAVDEQRRGSGCDGDPYLSRDPAVACAMDAAMESVAPRDPAGAVYGGPPSDVATRAGGQATRPAQPRSGRGARTLPEARDLAEAAGEAHQARTTLAVTAGAAAVEAEGAYWDARHPREAALRRALHGEADRQGVPFDAVLARYRDVQARMAAVHERSRSGATAPAGPQVTTPR